MKRVHQLPTVVLVVLTNAHEIVHLGVAERLQNTVSVIFLYFIFKIFQKVDARVVHLAMLEQRLDLRLILTDLVLDLFISFFDL